jgi:nucleotide-binding universal stress UspA family protein
LTVPDSSTAIDHPALRQDGPGGGSDAVSLLFPYSGSPTADAALNVAADWAHALVADVWVLYVRPWDTCRGGHYYVETRYEARAVAQAAMRRLRLRGVPASGVVRDADRELVAGAILAEADAVDARLIVLGTRSRGVVGRALLGSTSAAVARRATRPLIVVEAEQFDTAAPSPRQRPSL